jgi:hypothetical protein
LNASFILISMALAVLESQVLSLDLASSGLGLDVAGLVNITAF